MSDYCVNSLTVFGSIYEVESLIAAARGDSPFSLQKLLALPDVTSCADSEGYRRCEWGIRGDSTSGAQTITSAELPQRGCVNYSLESPWTPPVTALQLVSQRFPELLFLLRYDAPACELSGSFVIQNGTAMETSRTYSFIRDGERLDYLERSKDAASEALFGLVIQEDCLCSEGDDPDSSNQ